MTKKRAEKGKGYGQVFQTASPDFPHAPAFRGVLMDETFKEVWRGLPEKTPDIAFEKMKGAAGDHGITDLRKWSGTFKGGS